MNTSNPIENTQYRVIRIGKCWQGQSPILVFQASPGGSLRKQLPKKLFLLVDCQQQKRGLYFLDQKPQNLKIQGGISNILRKYVAQATVKEIFREKSSDDLWIPLYQSGMDRPCWYLKLSAQKPPDLSLISQDKDVLFRFGQKGTYTKKKKYEENLPFEAKDEYSSCLKEVIALYESSSKSNNKKNEAENSSPEDSRELEADNGIDISDVQRGLRQKLKRRVKTLKKSLEKLEKEIPTQNEIDDLRFLASLLQSYAYLIKKDMLELKLEASLLSKNADIVISLDPDLSPGQNVEKYFKNLKKLEKRLQIDSVRLEKCQKEYTAMNKELELLRTTIVSDEKIESIAKQLGVEARKGPIASKGPNSGSRPFSTFFGSDYKIKYLVGKGPKENDSLTKSAKSNDFWMHVIGGTGSHIVIPIKSLPQGGLNDAVKHEGAILAIHFSKFRQDMSGEVYITQRRNLRKQKGLAAGLWLVDQSQTYFVKYSSEELQSILNRKE